MISVDLLLILQSSILLGFCFYAYHNYLYVFASLFHYHHKKVKYSKDPVAVVIVSYNEGDILESTISACKRLTYKNKIIVLVDDSDKLEIVQGQRELAIEMGCQLINDHNISQQITLEDGTIIEEPVEIWESNSFVYFHRHKNIDFKGGSLRKVNEYLKQRGIRTMYLLDADWKPQADAIERTMEVLKAKPSTAFVQTKRLSSQKQMSLFQKYISINEEACYHIDFQGRQVLQHPVLFSGCCTLLDLNVIDSVGGFAGCSHLTEDLDLSNRLWVEGWRGIYLNDVVNYGDVPLSYNDFRRQQHRWAAGSARVLREHFSNVFLSRHLGLIGKLSILRQNSYFTSSLLTVLALIVGIGTISWLVLQSNSYAVELYLTRVGEYSGVINILVLLCVCSTWIGSLFSIIAFRDRWHDLIHLPIAIWVSWSNIHIYALGSLVGLLGISCDWFRTPKRSLSDASLLIKISWHQRARHLLVVIIFVGLYMVEAWYFGGWDYFSLLWIPAYSIVAFSLTE